MSCHVFSYQCLLPFWAEIPKLIKEVFVIVLAGVLILSGMTMMMNHNPIKLFSDHIDSKIGKAIVYTTSSLLGYIAGLVGIGGGIFCTNTSFNTNSR